MYHIMYLYQGVWYIYYETHIVTATAYCTVLGRPIQKREI